MRPPLVVPGISGRPLPPPPPGIIPPTIARPMFAAPPGPPPYPRPPFQPGPLIQHEDDFDALRPSVPQKPSFVKSAASTVVKRPLAQHNPELTAMVCVFPFNCHCISIALNCMEPFYALG